MNYILDILKENAINIRPTGSISGIVDNADGTYTITTDKIHELLIDNLKVTISDTPEFNDTYFVSNVDYDNLTYDIEDTSGKTITTFGTWVAESPYFFADYVEGYAESISEENYQKLIDQGKFPNIYVMIPLEESGEERGASVEVNPVILFVVETQHERDTEWRLENTIPYLRLMYETYLVSLLSDSRLYGKFNKSYREWPMYENPKGSKINSVIDVVQVSYTDIFLIKQSCN